MTAFIIIIWPNMVASKLFGNGFILNLEFHWFTRNSYFQKTSFKKSIFPNNFETMLFDQIISKKKKIIWQKWLAKWIAWGVLQK